MNNEIHNNIKESEKFYKILILLILLNFQNGPKKKLI